MGNSFDSFGCFRRFPFPYLDCIGLIQAVIVEWMDKVIEI